jgi:hypothetical protein
MGNTTAQKIGGIICFNSKAPIVIPKNEFNVYKYQFHKVKCEIKCGRQEQESEDTGDILIDTTYSNSYLNLNKGNMGTNLLKNFGTLGDSRGGAYVCFRFI